MPAAWPQARCAGCLVFSSCAETHTTTSAEVAGMRRVLLGTCPTLAAMTHHIHCPALNLATTRRSMQHMLSMPICVAYR
jgi:hypothetical protein